MPKVRYIWNSILVVKCETISDSMLWLYILLNHKNCFYSTLSKFFLHECQNRPFANRGKNYHSLISLKNETQTIIPYTVYKWYKKNKGQVQSLGPFV